MINPIATGRVSVISGMRGPCTEDFALVDFSEGVKVRPQTRQRVAFSLMRVPQVGQVLVFEDGLISGLISLALFGDYPLSAWIIPSKPAPVFKPVQPVGFMLF